VTQAACASPSITAQPQSTTITGGGSATLSATAGGTTPLAYQWYSGSTAISGATSSSITVSPSSTTSYFVRVTNTCGTVDSATATVTVCSYSATPSSFTFDTPGGSGSITVTSSASCAWSTSSTTSWITITSGASGSGNGTLGFTVAANAGTARTGALTVAGPTVTITADECRAGS